MVFGRKLTKNALVVSFAQNGIPHAQQLRFPVFFERVKVDEFIPDLVAFDKVIVDIKTVVAWGRSKLARC